MAKNQASGPSGGKPEREPAHTFEDLGRKVDEIPTVQQAEQALRRAREEFEKCQAHYQQAKQAAVDEIQSLREKNFADLLADVLNYVRRHPGQGLIGALLSGFFLGRIFRR
ncbi:MAG: hypothetical protein JNG90_01380 [Planctomycetaceae bacterium]|nr:hypothetical protein [Planctomycetaceae bacterium]